MVGFCNAHTVNMADANPAFAASLSDALILNDGHSTSIVEALTSGPGSDLAMEASYTP